MSEDELEVGCARPTGGPVGGEVPSEEGPPDAGTPKSEPKKEQAMIQVGKKAPDFAAPGYHNNKFVNVRLSNYLGKWGILCFYPGDFTFV